jgi:uncharacterized protein YkwD
MDPHMRLPARAICRIAFLLIMLLACISGATPTSMRAASRNFHVYLPLLSTAQASMEQQVIALVNQQRQQHGCAALVLSAQLSVAASGHSQDMALKNRFSHTGSDGSTMVSRAVAAGYSYSLLAENLAAGASTAADVVAGWMNSPGHRANMLNCELHELGVGYYAQMDDQANVQLDNGQIGGPYRYYWTQDFGSK